MSDEIPAQILQMQRELEQFAYDKLALHGLQGWTFGWDRAKSRLGMCKFLEEHISLSIYALVTHHQEPNELFDTILHEVAHALAWTRHGNASHDKVWKSICLEIGANPRRCAPAHLAPSSPPSYALRLKTTGEIVKTYHRKPTFKRPLKYYGLTNRPDTLGQLELIKYKP